MGRDAHRLFITGFKKQHDPCPNPNPNSNNKTLEALITWPELLLVSVLCIHITSNSFACNQHILGTHLYLCCNTKQNYFLRKQGNDTNWAATQPNHHMLNLVVDIFVFFCRRMLVRTRSRRGSCRPGVSKQVRYEGFWKVWTKWHLCRKTECQCYILSLRKN